jgi:hypothetical protein
MDDAIRVDVERTGGFGGLVTRRSVDTRSLPPEDGQQLARLVRGLDVDALTRTGPGRSVPDAFQYDILISTGDGQIRLHAQDPDVPAQLRPLIHFVVQRP